MLKTLLLFICLTHSVITNTNDTQPSEITCIGSAAILLPKLNEFSDALGTTLLEKLPFGFFLYPLETKGNTETEDRVIKDYILTNERSVIISIGHHLTTKLLEQAAGKINTPIIAIGGLPGQYATTHPLAQVTEFRNFAFHVEGLMSIPQPPKSIWLLYDPKSHNADSKEELAKLFQKHPVTFNALPISDPNQIETIIATAGTLYNFPNPDTILTLKDFTIISVYSRLAKICKLNNTRLCGSHDGAIAQGATMQYCVSTKQWANKIIDVVLEILDKKVPASQIPVVDVAKLACFSYKSQW